MFEYFFSFRQILEVMRFPRTVENVCADGANLTKLRRVFQLTRFMNQVRRHHENFISYKVPKIGQLIHSVDVRSCAEL